MNLPKISGIAAHRAIHFFTNKSEAYAFGEDMTSYGWIVRYENDGNCLAVITTEKIREERNCATC